MNQAILKLIQRMKSESWSDLLFERTLTLLGREAHGEDKLALTLSLVDAIQIVNAEAALLLLKELVTNYPSNVKVLTKLQSLFKSSGKKAKAFAVELEIAKLQEKPQFPLNWADLAVAPSLDEP